MCDEKEERKKKERNKMKEEEQIPKNFPVRFSQSWGEVMELWGYILDENS